MVDFFHDTENQRCVCKTDKLKSEIKSWVVIVSLSLQSM